MNPTHATTEVYLGRNGETFGPYTVEQFESIKATPEYATYTYIWDGREANPDWKPIEKAPAPVKPARRGPGAPPPDHSHPAARAAEPAAEPAACEPATARPNLRGYDVPGLEAVCHDSRNVITGKLTRVTDSGCELVCEAGSAQAFGTKARVVLNLLEPSSGRAMNVAARLGGVRRQDGRWSLKVLWNGCPELIVQCLEKTA